jgi:hypothetical protein
MKTTTLMVFITDQNFPPSLPAGETRCCVVLRLEDGLLSEQPGILKEFFGNRSRYLPEGSMLCFGSLSHLTMRGLETYADEVVKTFKVFSIRLSAGCIVAHTVLLPLGVSNLKTRSGIYMTWIPGCGAVLPV